MLMNNQNNITFPASVNHHSIQKQSEQLTFLYITEIRLLNLLL